MRVDTPACLGKVPTHGDFVRHRASTPTMREFDQWVRKGLHRARRSGDSEGLEAYDRGGTIRFLFSGRRAQAPNLLLGVLRASHDENGRPYPFVVAGEVPGQSVRVPGLSHLLVRAESFYDAAGELVEEATAGRVDHREIPDRIEQMSASIPADSTVSTPHREYLQHETIGTLAETLFAHFDDGQKYRLFANLFDILLPLRARTTPRLDYGLRFPLPADGTDRPKVAAFWVEVVLRVLDDSGLRPSIFWASSAPEEDASPLLLYVGGAGAGAFLNVLNPDRDDSRVYPLATAGDQSLAQASLSIPDEYGTLLETSDLCLWDFLRRL